MKLRILCVAILATASLTLPADFAGSERANTCGGERVTINGGAGDNRIRGTESHNVIAAGAGDDTVVGKGGNDTICGGPGDDVLAGGRGVDRLLEAATRTSWTATRARMLSAAAQDGT